jgi:hypothetical protein
MGPGGKCRLRLLHRIEQFGTGQEHDARAGQRQHPAAVSGIGLEIVAAALNRTERDRIDDEPRLEARFDREQAAHFPQHTHPLQSLSRERLHRSFEPFRP